MIRSFRILAGTLKLYFIMYTVIFGGTAVLGAASKLVTLDWLNITISGLAPMVSAIALETCALVTALGVFNINCSESTGYKYYHSLPNSAECFRDSLILVNLWTVLMTAVYAALAMAFFGVRFAMFAAGATLLAMGVLNFLGHLQSLWGKTIPLVIAGAMIGGFTSGFADELADGADAAVYTVFSFETLAIVIAVAFAVYIAGALFTVLKAKSAWEREV